MVTLLHSQCTKNPHPAISRAQAPHKCGRLGLSDMVASRDGSGMRFCLGPASTVSLPVTGCLTTVLPGLTASLRLVLTESFQAIVMNQWQRWDSLGTKRFLKKHPESQVPSNKEMMSTVGKNR